MWELSGVQLAYFNCDCGLFKGYFLIAAYAEV